MVYHLKLDQLHATLLFFFHFCGDMAGYFLVVILFGYCLNLVENLL